MLLKFVSVALVATSVFATAATAQNRRPAELPPSGFAGQQYVDSKGCLYVRAGHGGQTNWVARIDRTRKPICGMTPSVNTMAAARRALETEQPVRAAPPPPAPAPVAAAPRPQPVARPAPPPQPQYVAPAPARVAPVPTHNAPLGTNPVLGASRTAGCPAHAPYGQTYQRAGTSGTILVCGTQPPQFTGQRRGTVDQQGSLSPAGSAYDRVAQANWGPDTPINYAPQFADQAIQVRPPKGYKAAWDDGRLNPNRARGTVGGHTQMQQVWTTDEVPQRGINEPRHQNWLEKIVNPQPKKRQNVAVSYKSAPQVAVSAGRLVQIGSFGVPENANRAAQRLQSMGLPVRISRSTIKGKPVQVVSAGPFANGEQAQAALSAARRAGFSDAILRR